MILNNLPSPGLGGPGGSTSVLSLGQSGEKIKITINQSLSITHEHMSDHKAFISCYAQSV